MDGLRKPFFVAALVLITLVVLVEIGSPLVSKAKVGTGDFKAAMGDVRGTGLSPEDLQRLQKTAAKLPAEAPPGLGIPKMALLDSLVAFTALLMGLPFLLGDRLHGRIMGLSSCVFSVIVIIVGIVMVLTTLGEVLLMIGLFLAVPFGTLAYMAEWGFLRVGAAATILGVLLSLKLAFCICLLLAQQRFLQNKGLIFILLTSLLSNILLGFLHGLVPGPLVSITDGIGALIVLILALVWAVLMLIFGIISVIKAIV